MVARAEAEISKDVSYTFKGQIYRVKNVVVRVQCEAELEYYVRATRWDPCDWDVDPLTMSFEDDEIQNFDGIFDSDGNEVSDELFKEIEGEKSFYDDLLADFDYTEMIDSDSLSWVLYR